MLCKIDTVRGLYMLGWRFMYVRLDLQASILPLLQIGVLLFFEDNVIGKNY